MALRDQPYIPLMIKDWLTDEKLKECKAESIGVYIYIMCVMHKSKEYGTVLLQQKNKQTNDQIENFAVKLQKHMPFSVTVIYDAITELIDEDVIQIDVENEKISQKRMIKDNNISLKRASSGSKGGFATANKPAKNIANSVTANVSVNGNVKEPSLISTQLSNFLLEQIKINNPKSYLTTKSTQQNKVKTDKWAIDIDAMIAKDKRTEKEIKDIILFATSDMEFWHKNIQSGNKLRKHFDNLYVQMNKPEKEIDDYQRLY